MMYEHTITFHLTDEQEARLVALTVRYNRVLKQAGSVITASRLLESLLVTGSHFLIDERMAGIEAILDMKEREGEPE